MDLYLTFDVESHSFEINIPDDSIINRIENEAMPCILDLLTEFQAKATFFTTALFAQKSPETIDIIIKGGHELGCHGFDHNDYYDTLSLEKQIELIHKSKSIIEEVSNQKIHSFRAPALRINKDTVKALEINDLRFDSSISSQRFDGPFTSGAVEKLKWLFAPRQPYKLSYESPFRRGTSNISEVPISALIWPFICTHLRIAPSITFRILDLLILESKITNKPVVFLMHPQEILFFTKRKNLKTTNMFSGKFRHSLKLRNLGGKCIELFKEVLFVCKENNAIFKRIKEVEL